MIVLNDLENLILYVYIVDMDIIAIANIPFSNTIKM